MSKGFLKGLSDTLRDRSSGKDKFPNRKNLKFFVEELFNYEDEVNHHGKVTVDYETVSIEVYTLNLNSITELDYEYAKTADLIYQDVEYYSDK